MSWNSIIGQARVKKILQKSILENRISSSYLFWGVEGIGKEALAIQFAKTVNCIEPILFNNSIDSCDRCHSCLKIDKFTSNSLEMIFALPTGKTPDSKDGGAIDKLTDDQIQEIQSELKLKSQNLYHKIELTNANQIRIASIRELKQKMSRSSDSKGRRFVILFDIDKMTNESSNAFLKTLEEPNENVTLICTTSKIDMLLPTILSRCLELHCEPIDFENIVSFLKREFNKSETEARLIASFADGSIQKAESFLDGDIQNLRELGVNLLRTTLKIKSYRVELLGLIDSVTALRDKNIIEVLLNLMIKWLRDSILIKYNAIDKVINLDMIDSIKKFSDFYKKAKFEDAVTEIETAIRQLKRNVNSQLLLVNLFVKLRVIFLENKN